MNVTEDLLIVLGEEVVPDILNTLSDVFGIFAKVYKYADDDNDVYGIYSTNTYEETPYFEGYLLVNGYNTRAMAGSGEHDSISRDEVTFYTTTRMNTGDRVVFQLPSNREATYVITEVDEDWSTTRSVFRVSARPEHQGE